MDEEIEAPHEALEAYEAEDEVEADLGDACSKNTFTVNASS